MFVFKLLFTVLAGGKVGCEEGGVFIKIRMYYFKIDKIYTDPKDYKEDK